MTENDLATSATGDGRKLLIAVAFFWFWELWEVGVVLALALGKLPISWMVLLIGGFQTGVYGCAIQTALSNVDGQKRDTGAAVVASLRYLAPPALAFVSALWIWIGGAVIGFVGCALSLALCLWMTYRIWQEWSRRPIAES